MQPGKPHQAPMGWVCWVTPQLAHAAHQDLPGAPDLTLHTAPTQAVPSNGVHGLPPRTAQDRVSSLRLPLGWEPPCCLAPVASHPLAFSRARHHLEQGHTAQSNGQCQGH